MREAKRHSLFTFQEKREVLREKEDEKGFVHFREKIYAQKLRSTGALTQAQKSRGEYDPFNAVQLHLCAQKSRSTAAINAV